MLIQLWADQRDPLGWLRIGPGTAGSGHATGIGAAPDADLHLSASRIDDFHRLFTDDGCGAARAHELLVRREGGEWAPHPPLDVEIADQPLDLISGADVHVRHIVRSSLLGTLDFCDVFVDGRLAARDVSCDQQAQVTVHSTFRLLTRAYNPELNSLDAVTGMRIEPAHRALIMVAAGLYDDRSFRAFLDRRATENRMLADASELGAAEALVELAESVTR